MEKDVGDKRFPIWPLGDSNPRNWERRLNTPLDPRHLARHNIWTPVLDGIQDRLFRESRARLDTRQMYIRNAIQNAHEKPENWNVSWNENLEQELTDFRKDLEEYNPRLLITFGAFSYEFARRSRNEDPVHPHGFWGAERIGLEFRKAIGSMHLDRINVVPLLHATISRGHFLKSHELFCGYEGANYFEDVALSLSEVLLVNQNMPELSGVWIVDPVAPRIVGPTNAENIRS